MVRSMLVAGAVLALLSPSAAARRPPAVLTTAATDVGADVATLNGMVTPYRTPTTYQFRYGIDGYEIQTPLASVPGSREPVAVAATVTGLAPDTTYHVQLVAFGPRRVVAGSDVTFRTSPAPLPPLAVVPALVPLSPAASGPAVFAAPPPVFGERVNVSVRQGIVTVKAPGGTYVPLRDFGSVPVGSIINTRRGSITLTSALPDGSTQAGIFHGGLSEVRQPKSAAGATALVLRGRRRACASTATVSARRRHRRALWGNVRHGNFRIRGGNSVASVRGTIWYVEDRCDGTLTRVKRGRVAVRDLRRHRTVVVRAGHSYLARVRR